MTIVFFLQASAKVPGSTPLKSDMNHTLWQGPRRLFSTWQSPDQWALESVCQETTVLFVEGVGGARPPGGSASRGGCPGRVLPQVCGACAAVVVPFLEDQVPSLQRWDCLWGQCLAGHGQSLAIHRKVRACEPSGTGGGGGGLPLGSFGQDYFCQGKFWTL